MIRTRIKINAYPAKYFRNSRNTQAYLEPCNQQGNTKQSTKHFRDLSIFKLSPLLASLIASCRDATRKSFVLSISMIRDDYIVPSQPALLNFIHVRIPMHGCLSSWH